GRHFVDFPKRKLRKAGPNLLKQPKLNPRTTVMTPSLHDLRSSTPASNNRLSPAISAPDLDEARRVQQQLLPRAIQPPPGWDIVAAYRPARIVAGDYCDVIDLGAGRIALALGDVSGKGLGPALVMAGLRAWIHARLPQKTADLAGLMRELNV